MIRKHILLAAAFVSFIAGSRAQNPNMAQVDCGPYVQCVTQTGFTVSWTTDMDALAWVEVAPDDGTHFYHSERDKYYDRRGHGVFRVGKIHHIEVDGLQPGTRYRYRIMYKGVTSYTSNGGVAFVNYLNANGTDVYKGMPHVISTFKEQYDTLNFDIYNDIHARDSILDILTTNMKDDRDFVLINGDMTSHITGEEMITDLYLKTLARNLKGNLPLFVSRGNHEWRGPDALKWFDYFRTPGESAYYSFKIGKFFFVVLDGGEDKPDSDIEYNGTVISEPYMKQQEEWLTEVLASDDCRSAEVRIAICHIPPAQNGWYGMARLCERFVPHLNEAGIDVMFSGHIHRWRVSEPDGSISNAAFPIICNPNAQRMEVTVTNRKIDIKTFNHKGTNTNSHTINLK